MAKVKETINNDFEDYESDSLTKPRDLAWDKWFKFEKLGDKVQGYIRDVFYRPAEEPYKEQRGLTLEQLDGTLVNVGIKRLPFILNKTDSLRLGDPLTIEWAESKDNGKGKFDTKIMAFYGKNLEGNTGKTVAELEAEDMAKGGSKAPLDPEAKTAEDDDIPFE